MDAALSRAIVMARIERDKDETIKCVFYSFHLFIYIYDALGRTRWFSGGVPGDWPRRRLLPAVLVSSDE